MTRLISRCVRCLCSSDDCGCVAALNAAFRPFVGVIGRSDHSERGRVRELSAPDAAVTACSCVAAAISAVPAGAADNLPAELLPLCYRTTRSRSTLTLAAFLAVAAPIDRVFTEINAV
jgi:hypothetical protein